MNKNTINIVKMVIDIEALMNEIDVRKGIDKPTLNFIIMNDESLKQLRNWWNENDPVYKAFIMYDGYESIRGIPIAICNKLKLGEIEFV